MKKVAAFIAGGISSFLIASPVFAAIDICPQQAPGQAGQFNPLCATDVNQLGRIIGTAITLIFILAIILALVYLIWGGAKWLISGGDKAALEEARNHIIAAIIGLVIIFLSYFILQIVVGFFVPGFSFSNIQLPSIR